ncbi:MAG: nickel-dependent hydrogenase large subunit [Chloroflexi bacterium]|nr:nickel-dependent hydrogenase large subunit [Chloroflexota bacterium]
MSTTITIDPSTRLEGHLKVTATYDAGHVITAESSGLMFRGFENLLIGKDPRDAAHITQRVCGVCPVCHAMAACLAMEAAAGRTVTDNARLIRNLILGADFLHSHILHFYQLALPSFIRGPAMPPWTPAWEVDLRFTASDNQHLVDHYVQALTARRQAHEMGAILGGRLPHTAAYEFGGVTSVPKAALVTRFRTYLTSLVDFIDDVYVPDVDLLGQTYPEYYAIGRGYGNLLAFGVFDLNASGSVKLLGRGRVVDGAASVQNIDLGVILEEVQHSWYDASADGLNPSQGLTQPYPEKPGAYSWLKAPRYAGAPYETGPLARMWVNGDYRHGISVMDRHQARAREASRIAHAMLDWLNQLNLAASSFTPIGVPTSAVGVGLTEAPRGALGHWLTISNKAVARYQIVTPTCWNCSPRDAAGLAGPLEKALEGLAISDVTQPIEVQRVVQSYDPCLACAVH